MKRRRIKRGAEINPTPLAGALDCGPCKPISRPLSPASASTRSTRRRCAGSGGCMRLILTLGTPGRGQRLRRFLTRIELEVECILFCEALLRYGPPPRRRRHPRPPPIGIPPHTPPSLGALLQARRRARARAERAQPRAAPVRRAGEARALHRLFSRAPVQGPAHVRAGRLSAAGVVARRRCAGASRVRRQFVSGDTHNFPAATRAIGRTATGKLCVSPPNAPPAEQDQLAQPFVLRERWTPKRLSSPLRGGDGGGGDGDVLSERARAFLKRRRRHPHPRPRPARGRGEARVRSRRGAFAP
jgi:hypothetical protein